MEVVLVIALFCTVMGACAGGTIVEIVRRQPTHLLMKLSLVGWLIGLACYSVLYFNSPTEFGQNMSLAGIAAAIWMAMIGIASALADARQQTAEQIVQRVNGNQSSG